jgi:RNA polymerase sigma factor (sigma-70 family)
MSKLLLLLSTALLILLVAFIPKDVSKSDAPAAQNPNVIVIVADDLGYADVGFNGCKDIPTPNIDRIAKAGVVFSSGHVSFGVCSPSRAGFLTGRYQYRFGYERNPLYVPADSTMGLPLSEETMADVLGRSGYNSMLVGKWHLGAHKSLHPLKRGFNEFFGFLGGGHQYFPDKWTIQNPEDANGEGESYRTKLNRNYTPVEETEYLTDAFSREAVSFVERNKTKPFFLYLAYNAPHNPAQATEKYLNRFENIKNPKRRTYAAMVSAVDDGVGNLLNKLTETGVIDNTIIVFISDNGGTISDKSQITDETNEWLDLIDLQTEYQTALQELPEKCREVFTMSRNGATNKEIGEALNISTKTVEQHITKALRTLRVLLNSHLNTCVGMVILVIFSYL